MTQQAAEALAGVALLLALAVVVLVLWRRGRSRTKLGTDERAAELRAQPAGDTCTHPPAEVSPGLAGALIVPAARYQHTTATLLDLAERGHLQLKLEDKDTGWWTLTSGPGRDDLRDHEQVLLAELGVATGPIRFPNLTNQSVDRVTRALRRDVAAHRDHTDAVIAFQRGVAHHADDVDPQWFAHAVALDVGLALARSLSEREIPAPRWATTPGRTPMTWSLLHNLAIQGSPFDPSTPTLTPHTGVFGT